MTQNTHTKTCININRKEFHKLVLTLSTCKALKFNSILFYSSLFYSSLFFYSVVLFCSVL